MNPIEIITAASTLVSAMKEAEANNAASIAAVAMAMSIIHEGEEKYLMPKVDQHLKSTLENDPEIAKRFQEEHPEHYEKIVKPREQKEVTGFSFENLLKGKTPS